MNSLNILSGRVSPPQTPSPSRSNSYGNVLSSISATEARNGLRDNALSEDRGEVGTALSSEKEIEHEHDANEDTPLLSIEKSETPEDETKGWLALPKRISSALIDTIRWLLSAVASPGIYLISLLYGDDGAFKPFSYFYRGGKPQITSKPAIPGPGTSSEQSARRSGRRASRDIRFPPYSSSSSGLSSDSESDRDRLASGASSNRGPRTKTAHHVDEISPARRSIRIKLHNEDNLRQRNRRAQVSSSENSDPAPISNEITPATLKSPTSQGSSLSMTKYPRAPAPPRPLIPRRQPSFTIQENPTFRVTQKTLILDLDETLIHSMAKGGRMSTGHMVEVKLNTVVGSGTAASVGPQHPILYYVHKRPYCDEFLRKVCKWYNLVIFTASVQEYADPVIDWLEQERKFFSGRYYRQHCTLRHNAYIKDLSSVEPDLSKVMILDNSPLSYMFHQDNAIPIEGWISDPSDNNLLHLVPLLEGLQYVTDVRAFLALRGGEDGKHIA